MIKKKVLIVAPYPITKPYHGGQKRAKAIFEFYRNIFQEVKFVGIFHRGQYPDWGDEDLPLGQPDLIEKVDKKPYASELICGEAIDEDVHVRSPMAKLLTEYEPDIIHIEQPFAYLGLKPLLAKLEMSPKLIFGSQNIEYTLKERIFRELKVPSQVRESLVKKTEELEYDLSKKADLLVTVNGEDAQSHKQMGAKKIIIVPNGIDKATATKESIEYWDAYKKKKLIKNIVVFVGSGHPPNWEGFLKSIGSDTSFMPKDSKIFVVGGVADYFKNEYKDTKKRADFWKGVELIGKLEEAKLTALLEVSDLIVLPITTERGSNLKTAEAILSGKKIVATSYAFHGFESFRKLPNIKVANNQGAFRKSIIEALQAEYITRRPRERRLAERVRWENCLKPIIPGLKQLSRSINRERALERLEETKVTTRNRVKGMIRRLKS